MPEGSTINAVESPAQPMRSERAMLALLVFLCVSTIAAAIAALWSVHGLHTRGVIAPGTVLGAAPTAGDSRTYVRFLWRDQAVIATSPTPLGAPDHGTRVRVLFLPDDPPGSAMIIGPGEGYATPALALVTGIAAGAVVVSRYGRRSAPRRKDSS